MVAGQSWCVIVSQIAQRGGSVKKIDEKRGRDIKTYKSIKRQRKAL